MPRNYAIVETDDFKSFLRELIEREVLDGPALGITKHVISNGIKSLSDKQLPVFKIFVLDKYTIAGCEVCGSDISWSEMFEAATGTKLCSNCASKMEDDN
jgi:hypothetical protein